MTDRELLEKAAKAAVVNYEIRYIDPDGVPFKGLLIRAGAAHYPHEFWNPLTDDGDALRLAVGLGICIGPNFDGDRAIADGGEFSQFHAVEMFSEDRYAATRRAIVRAAAAIGETL